MVAGRSASRGRGPTVRFEGIQLEMSSFSGCQFDFAKDGILVLAFDNFSGTVTLRSPEEQERSLQKCSSESDAGSVGVLDSVDVDMALSQLEQDSPRSDSGMYSASAMRQMCEGKAHHGAIDSPGKLDNRSSTSVAVNCNEGISAVISPSSSSKRKISGDNGAQGSPIAGAPKRSAMTSVPARENSPPGTTRSLLNPTTRAVSPDTTAPELDSKPKGKRARRTREEPLKESAPAKEVESGGPKPKQENQRAKAKTPQSSQSKQRPKKQCKRTREKRSSVIPTPPVELMGATEQDAAGEKETRSKTGPINAVTRTTGRAEEEKAVSPPRPSSISEEPPQTIDEDQATDDHAQSPAGRGTQRPRGSPSSRSNSASPTPSAAAAWIASAAPSSPGPGPLSRSAKADLVHVRRGRGAQDGGGEADDCGPMGRWGHSATMISESRMLVLGGQADDEAHQATLGDLYRFDFGTNTWSRPMNCDSTPRAWHTATFIPGKNLLVIFGGERTVDGCPECLDDIMVLDTDIDLWYPPAISGKPPTSRSGHSAAIIGTDLIVFGGVRGRKWQNNVAVLDTERWHWRHPTIDGSNPAPRSYHSATVVGTMMVVFGGNNQHESFDRVHVLDTSKSRWEWFSPEVVGAARAARTGHSAVLLPDGYTILVHGGWDPEDEGGVKNFGDAYLLDTRLWEWSRGPESLLPLGASSPGADRGDVALRVGHTALLARGPETEEGDSEKENEGGVGDVERAGKKGWKMAFLGGQDGAGVRHSDLAVLSL